MDFLIQVLNTEMFDETVVPRRKRDVLPNLQKTIARITEAGFQSWKETIEGSKLRRMKPAKTKTTTVGDLPLLDLSNGLWSGMCLICF